jgi:hypothetical protein
VPIKYSFLTGRQIFSKMQCLWVIYEVVCVKGKMKKTETLWDNYIYIERVRTTYGSWKLTDGQHNPEGLPTLFHCTSMLFNFTPIAPFHDRMKSLGILRID